jgi:hypothetical protein
MLALLSREVDAAQVERLHLVPSLVALVIATSPALAARVGDADMHVQTAALRVFSAVAARSDGASLKRLLTPADEPLSTSASTHAASASISGSGGTAAGNGDAMMLALTTALATSASDVDSLALKEEAARALSALAMHMALKSLLLQHSVHHSLLNELGTATSARASSSTPTRIENGSSSGVAQRLKGIQEAAAITLYYLSHAGSPAEGQPSASASPSTPQATTLIGLGNLSAGSAANLVRAISAELSAPPSAINTSMLEFITATIAAVATSNGA